MRVKYCFLLGELSLGHAGLAGLLPKWRERTLPPAEAVLSCKIRKGRKGESISRIWIPLAHWWVSTIVRQEFLVLVHIVRILPPILLGANVESKMIEREKFQLKLHFLVALAIKLTWRTREQECYKQHSTSVDWQAQSSWRLAVLLTPVSLVLSMLFTFHVPASWNCKYHLTQTCDTWSRARSGLKDTFRNWTSVALKMCFLCKILNCWHVHMLSNKVYVSKTIWPINLLRDFLWLSSLFYALLRWALLRVLWQKDVNWFFSFLLVTFFPLKTVHNENNLF